MRKDTLAEAAEEARRFLKATDALVRANDKLCKEDPENKPFKHYSLDLARFTADVRRKSMDLSRVLSRLRANK